VVQTKQGAIPHWFRVSLRQFAKYGPYLGLLYLMNQSMSSEYQRTGLEYQSSLFFAFLISLSIASSYWIVSYLWIKNDDSNRRAIHDFLAGTRIVYRPFGKMSHSRRRSPS
jgi:uncharacterized RDD family membrane protein YckC